MEACVILAVGDIAPDRPDPDTSYDAVRVRLTAADLTLAQLETTFAAKGLRLPQARHAVLAPVEGAGAVARAGIDVISMAGNHCLDWGSEAMLECIGHLEGEGVAVVGAGPDIAAARKPVIRILPDGSRVAVLAYSSILPQAYWAEDRRPGCAPMRAHTLYEQVEHDQPGTPARIHTFAHRGDLAALEADIRAARAEADLVVVSLHWGIHFVRAVIADYQREVAKAAIAAGADAIFGHHAHILKGIEVIDGRPVFHSLCNFACDLRMDEAHANSKSFKEIQTLAEDWVPDFDSLYNFPKASALSMVARLDIRQGRLVRAGFHPVHIGRDAVPRFTTPDDPKFSETVEYMRAVTAEAGLNGDYTIDGDLVVVGGIG
ncbi:hypothetical protein ABAC460_13055 [Asticcacaulis sp. AC460]|uniref:CapA family protein n=1 Tax=Asticcacaulis sp. AC460 TaxID=1282360 RepID=UPI0003C3D9FC|nr:CapA family protein [Asticcacaulis sp. AC460]ESQ89219.1 hypothetical protein ABAC460_13055 [Asticcacaulis sp. AC460]